MCPGQSTKLISKARTNRRVTPKNLNIQKKIFGFEQSNSTLQRVNNALHRHSGESRNPGFYFPGPNEKVQRLIDKHWIPAFAGMTVIK